MFKVCEKCGFMYDDSCGACPQCNNGSADQTETKKVEINDTKGSQQPVAVQSAASVNNDTSKSSEKSSGSNIPKPLIAFFAVLLVVIIVAVISVVDFDFLKNNQPSNNDTHYEDEHQFDDEDQIVETTSDQAESKFWVYFDPNNGDPVKQVKMQPGYIEEPEEPVRDGYIFEGWYDIDLENEWDFDNSEVDETIVLYAKWSEEPEEYAENEKLVLAVDGLRLRESPSISGKKISLIPNGTIITVTETVDGWSYTTYKNKSGWCSSDYLFDPADYEGEILFKAYVDNKQGLTLYVDEDTDSTIINDNISYKSTVYVYEVDDLWSYVSYGDQYGWCLSEHLDDY